MSARSPTGRVAATQASAGEPPAAAAKTLCESGLAQHARGDYEQAIASFGEAIARDPGCAEAHDHLGRSLNNLGRLDEAARAFREALRLRPDYAAAHDNLGHVLRAQGAPGDAANEFAEAVRLDPGLSRAHRNLGIVQLALGQPGRAVESLEEAARLEPGHAHGQVLLGLARAAAERPARALASFRKALELEPGNIEARLNLGLALSELRRMDEAEAALTQAAGLAPGDARVWVELAALYQETSRLDDMRLAVGRALELAPGDPRVILEAARCDRRAGNIDAALARLLVLDLSALPPRLAQHLHHELGLIRDRRDEVDAAFRHFSEAKRLGLENGRLRHADPERFLRQIEALHACFSTARIADWAEPAPIAPGDTPVFLLGFPRSGTTLIDVLLDGHPQVRTLEEQPTIERVVAALDDSDPGGITAALPGLSAADIEALRALYFREVDRHVRREPGVVLIDKLPIRSVHAGVIWRLFPRAKLIFALRHPCDVCLSGFMQRYRMNDAFANFATLASTVRVYDKAMRLWKLYVSVLELDCHAVRYEELVDDPERETRRLIAYLGLPWDDAVLDHTRRARERGRIWTSSYHQVTEPVYRRARYRWLRYREHLEPELERLAPHIADFGYDRG